MATHALDHRLIHPTPKAAGTIAWWQARWFVLAAVLAVALPLAWPAIPPLTDLPGHLGGYRILAEAGRGPLAHHYAVHWVAIGNLGVELAALGLRPLIGLEPATKLVVMLIPMLFVLALLWAAREAHGRIPAAVPFALPLAYALPFQLGFVNFWLGGTLAILGLAWWLRLARLRPASVRVALFVPIAGVVWLCHMSGWALLGLVIFGAECARQRRAGRRWLPAAALAAAMCAPMAWPVVVKLALTGNQLSGPTGDWLHWSLKLLWMLSLLRERWRVYDLLCVGILFFVLILAARSPRLSYDPVLGWPALLVALAFVALPRFIGGGSYVDMRVLPFAVALGLAAIRVAPGEDRLAARLATAGTALFALRVVTSTIALALFANGQAAAIRPIGLFPSGSAVLVLVPEPAIGDWEEPRLEHIDGVAVERRRVFTNGQWALSGQQLIRPLHPEAAPYERDPSQLIHDPTGHAPSDFDAAIARFDRGLFDYVWTIDRPAGRAHAADLRLIWSDGRSAIYRVMPRATR